MSIYPTICGLTGVTLPDHVEGLDISTLLKNPEAPWDTPALTTYHQDNHSFRSEQWRYIRYADGSEELYNHEIDPFEWNNVAGDANYADIKAAFATHIPAVNAPELPGGGGRARARNRNNAAPAEAE
jgi:arylsulfatase A-like enzyme